MTKITEEVQVRYLLGKYYFEMFNKANNHEGELTTLSENDIDNMIGDMKLAERFAPVMTFENAELKFEYPNKVCTLISRAERKENTKIRWTIEYSELAVNTKYENSDNYKMLYHKEPIQKKTVVDADIRTDAICKLRKDNEGTRIRIDKTTAQIVEVL